MKIGAVTLAYNDEGVISGTLKCLKPFVDKHIVLISEVPYFGKPSKPDRTEEICEDLGAIVIKGNWELDHHQRSLGNKLCEDCDWVLGFDSDEMMTKEELEKLIHFLRETDHKALTVRPEVYWKTTDYRLRPTPEYEPVVAMKPEVRFTYIRNIDTHFGHYDGTMHHLSWCHPKDIYKKVTNYAHATDFDGEKWYREHYENWDGGDAVLPTDTFQTEFNPLPQELKNYL